MNEIMSRVLEMIPKLVVGLLTAWWLWSAGWSAFAKRWNDFFYSLSILFIMWSGLGLQLGVVCVFLAVWVHGYIALREDEEVDSESSGGNN